jgi:dipeptidyl aminopeptidase/acylaminoacyl peptidase
VGLKVMRPRTIFLFRYGVLLCLVAWISSGFAQPAIGEPIRRTIEFGDSKREYYVHLPEGFDQEVTYRILVSVHGGGGNGRSHFLAEGFRRFVDETGFGAIVVSPSFSNTDFQASRFPELGEGEFLKRVLEDLHGRYRLHKKILLSGYSRGGQFSHRFALGNPGLVEAVVPCAAGTWTTPDGELLIESIGAVENPRTFLGDAANAGSAPERLEGLFTERVARVAGMQARPGAEEVPFLVMCGSLDTRFDIAQQFARSLKDNGYTVETEWPRTPHGSRDKEEYKGEFEKYARSAAEFFQRITAKK